MIRPPRLRGLKDGKESSTATKLTNDLNESMNSELGILISVYIITCHPAPTPSSHVTDCLPTGLFPHFVPYGGCGGSTVLNRSSFGGRCWAQSLLSQNKRRLCQRRQLLYTQRAESRRPSADHQGFSTMSLHTLLIRSRKFHLARLRLVLVLDVGLRTALGRLLATLGWGWAVCPLALEAVELLLEL